MRKKTQRIKYLSADLVSASLMWLLFNVVRFEKMAVFFGFSQLSSYLTNPIVLRGQVLVPLFWVALSALSGYYNKPIGKSRFDELLLTALTSLLGTLTLFFFFVLNDWPIHRYIYYDLFFYLLIIAFVFTYLPRLFITQQATRKIQKREWTTRVLLIGRGKTAETVREALEKPTKALSYTVVDVIDPEQADQLADYIKDQHIAELIVADSQLRDESKLLQVVYVLYSYKLPIKVPLQYDKLLTIKASSHSIAGGLSLVDLSSNRMTEAAKNCKWLLDKCLSVLALLLLSPVFLYLAIRIKRDSKGPIFFKQERIGYQGKTFTIYKFRTMKQNAEEDLPLLSSAQDERITRIGQWMRRYRLDELPQFWNVLKGDMSLVGPRPERKYYIKQIVKRAPWFYLLHNTKPGITSWGMVKYGYAENVDQMIERLQYDLVYYENMSLLSDFKVLIFTIKTIVMGEGV